MDKLERILGDYDPDRPLELAETIPASWYLEPEVLEHERRRVFQDSWQQVARLDQLSQRGSYVTADVAGEPVVVVRGQDDELRAFFNVCRHHAAAVCTAAEGTARVLRCPYHGWTYRLDGTLKGTPEFDGVEDFDRTRFGLVPMRVAVWESFVFVCLDEATPPLEAQLTGLGPHLARLEVTRLAFVTRRVSELACNWKVFVDNYLDGGYHVPLVHRGLGAVLDHPSYRIETTERGCIQSSPLSDGSSDASALRAGATASYLWLYPNFMVNVYRGVMDTNLVLPLGVDRCRVIIDLYFADDMVARDESIALTESIQREDVGVCESVQRGLGSRSYRAGRLSLRREAGEHLFHRLLHADLTR
jgi:choline monooxygenase